MPPRPRTRLAFALVALWVAGLAGGFVALQAYAGRPGRLASPGVAGSAWLEAHRRPGRALVVMAIHARCPCTDASLAELGDFLSRSHGACDVVLVRYTPDEAASLRDRDVRVLGGVSVPVVADPDGRLSAGLGARTSGSVVLVDAAGQIRFRGGLTLARGHRGASPAQAVMLAALTGAPTANTSAPVYGCALPDLGGFKPEVCR